MNTKDVDVLVEVLASKFDKRNLSDAIKESHVCFKTELGGKIPYPNTKITQEDINNFISSMQTNSNTEE